jgi:tellurite resistance protein
MDVSLLAIVFVAIALFMLRSAKRRKPRRRSSSPGQKESSRTQVIDAGQLVVEISTSVRSNLDRRLEPVESARAGNGAWVPAGRAVKVAGYKIPEGMIYVGRELEPVTGLEDTEPALIDPSLAVERRSPDRAGSLMDYWPSYSRIEPASRAAYLEWLSTGRSDPKIGIGHVFLFFYGLERRLLCDLQHHPEGYAEAEILMREVERLLAIYGSNRSFKHYAVELLHTAQALWGRQLAYHEAPTYGETLDVGHINVRLALAQLVADQKPIPAPWAFAWVLCDPETKLRKPATRCPNRFRDLFTIRYEQAFGEGMKLEPKRTSFELPYSPASRSLAGAGPFKRSDLPDVVELANPRRQLRELAEQVMNDLGPYSRFIGRNPEEAESLEALSLLPAELTAGDSSRAIEDVTTWLDFTLGLDPAAEVSAGELMQHWVCARDDRMSKAELESFATALDGLGFGVEPDPRFGGGGIKPDQTAVIFELVDTRLKSATPAYRVATLLLHLTALVATSDGRVQEEEERELEAHLERFVAFNRDERQRLRMHLRWLLGQQPRFAGMKQRLARVDARQRQKLAEYAVAMAAADGVIEASEVRTVENIYELLGFDPAVAHQELHELRAEEKDRLPAQEPTVVRSGSKVESGFSIPEVPEIAPTGDLQLDSRRIQQVLADTEAVSTILSEIFEDGEGKSGEVVNPVIAESETEHNGLDTAHALLLESLADSTELSRAGFERLAAEFGLPPDGAYEVLNELAFENVDAPLFEGSDPIDVNLAVLREIME